MPQIFDDKVEIKIETEAIVKKSKFFNPIDFKIFKFKLPKKQLVENHPKTYPFVVNEPVNIHIKKRSASWSS